METMGNVGKCNVVPEDWEAVGRCGVVVDALGRGHDVPETVSWLEAWGRRDVAVKALGTLGK